jgi:hypothetical protein
VHFQPRTGSTGLRKHLDVWLHKGKSIYFSFTLPHLLLVSCWWRFPIIAIFDPLNLEFT